MVETTTASTENLQNNEPQKRYKIYDAVILSDTEQMHLFGKKLSFRNGFIAEDRIDWWAILEDYLQRPVVSVRPSGRESWNEIIVLCAKGFLKDSLTYLDYDNLDDYKTVLSDIFSEADNDEYEVFTYYRGCYPKIWKQVEEWVCEVY